MHRHLSTARKGQSAIEYLTTYGWAILIIGVVIAFLVSQGVFSQCSTTTPRFTGADARLTDSWGFQDASTVALEAEATTSTVTLNDVFLDTDGDGDYTDSPGSASTSPGVQLSPGAQPNSFTVNVANEFSSGECASMSVRLNVTTGGQWTLQTGNGVLQTTVP